MKMRTSISSARLTAGIGLVLATVTAAHAQAPGAGPTGSAWGQQPPPASPPPGSSPAPGPSAPAPSPAPAPAPAPAPGAAVGAPAAPAADGTEDRDAPVAAQPAGLPWYLPPGDANALAVHPQQPMLTTVELGYHTMSDDLSGNVTDIGFHFGSEFVGGGVLLGKESLKLTEMSSTRVKEAQNDATMFGFSLDLVRNFGMEFARQDDLHLFVMAPSLSLETALTKVQASSVVGGGTGDVKGNPFMFMGAVHVPLVGVRLQHCSGWAAELRFPVVSYYLATRDYDTTQTAGATDNSLTASSISYGVSLRIGYNRWKVPVPGGAKK